MNWPGRVVTQILGIVELVASTKTSVTPTVQYTFDPKWYPTGTATTPPSPYDRHGEWITTFQPKVAKYPATSP
jgi:hypothetical protein